MPKKPKSTATPEEQIKGEAHHCWNCGQEVEGKTAEAAATIGVAFCCHCGTQLSAAGKCRNNVCPFFGDKPLC